MGNTFEVWSWEEDDLGYCRYVQIYAGDDYNKAIQIMHGLKIAGAGCVKLEWR